MGSRTWKVALAAIATMAAAGACAPLPQPPEPLRVNTTAETFDGECDEVNCSLADAIHASNTRPPHASGLPNEIRVPAGTYTFTGATPLVITSPVVINGAGRTATILDLSDSPITAPSGVLDPRHTTVLTGVRVVSDAASPEHVLASCGGPTAAAFSLADSVTAGLAAVSAGCDAVFLGAEVTGPASVISPNAMSATGSRLPFPDEPLAVTRATFVNTVLTGPSDETGTEDSTLRLRAKGGSAYVTFTGSHFDRVGLESGDPAGGGVVFTESFSSSFDLAGSAAPLTVSISTGSTLLLHQSTVFGGGSGGAVLADGDVTLSGATIANAGPGVVAGPGATVTARRSILSTLGAGHACGTPITLQAHNLLIDDSCGTPSGTDQTVAGHAELQLEDPTDVGSRNPSHSFMPLATSPAVDVIAKEGPGGLDCPYNVELNMGGGVDNRGFWRPNGEACDIGAVEYIHPTAPVTTTTTLAS
jgi:hypothetical protein